MKVTCKNHTMAAVDTTIPTINRDYYCIHCGYNLRTLSVAGLCPECGHPVNDSLQTDMELKWLHRVRRGFTWLLIAWFFQSLLYLVHGLGYLGNLLSGWYFPRSIVTCMQTLGIVLNILACIGIYRVTAFSLYSRTALKCKSLVLSTRICVLLAIPLMFLITILDTTRILSNTDHFFLFFIGGICMAILLIGHIVLASYISRLLCVWTGTIRKLSYTWIVLLVIQLFLSTSSMVTSYLAYRLVISSGGGMSGPSPLLSFLITVQIVINLVWALLCALFAVYFFRRCRTILSGVIADWQMSIEQEPDAIADRATS